MQVQQQSIPDHRVASMEAVEEACSSPQPALFDASLGWRGAHKITQLAVLRQDATLAGSLVGARGTRRYRIAHTSHTPSRRYRDGITTNVKPISVCLSTLIVINPQLKMQRNTCGKVPVPSL